MSNLPNCPDCSSVYTYEDGGLYMCPECGHEWSKDAETHSDDALLVKDANGNDTTDSTYYPSANRNKESVTIDFTRPDGQKLIRDLAAKCDIVIENFKVGGLTLGIQVLLVLAWLLAWTALDLFPAIPTRG